MRRNEGAWLEEKRELAPALNAAYARVRAGSGAGAEAGEDWGEKTGRRGRAATNFWV